MYSNAPKTERSVWETKQNFVRLSNVRISVIRFVRVVRFVNFLWPFYIYIYKFYIYTSETSQKIKPNDREVDQPNVQKPNQIVRISDTV